jgi:hypothetical protein
MERIMAFPICIMPPTAPGIHGWSLPGAGLVATRAGDRYGTQIGGSETGQSNASGGKRAG